MSTNEILPLFNQESQVFDIDNTSGKNIQSLPVQNTSSSQFITPYNLHNEVNSLNGLLNKMFPENRAEDKELLKVKQILGERGKTLSESEIKDLMTKIQYLIASWLDEYERQIFDGQTLNELLSSKQI